MIALLLAIVTALFFPGIIIRVKSLVSGRKGPGILQPWKNILVLLKKSSVFSTTTSYIFRIAPLIYLATLICAILLLPFPGSISWFSFGPILCFWHTCWPWASSFLSSAHWIPEVVLKAWEQTVKRSIPCCGTGVFHSVWNPGPAYRPSLHAIHLWTVPVFRLQFGY